MDPFVDTMHLTIPWSSLDLKALILLSLFFFFYPRVINALSLFSNNDKEPPFGENNIMALNSLRAQMCL